MKIITGISIVFLAIFIFVGSNTPAFAAEKMTYEEYQAQLQVHQDREARANEAVDAENQKIKKIEKQIKDVESRIAATWSDIYVTAGISKDGLDDFMKKIPDLQNRIEAIEVMSPSQLLDKVAEINALISTLDEMMQNPACKIEKARGPVSNLQARAERLKNAIPKPKHDWYAVLRGDYLWRISGKSDIYNDPWKWMRIYSSNREQIKDPDLIYPDQKFRISRQIGRDEHLVVRGEFLSKIAGYSEVYGDPFKWTKIYQANKTSGYMQDPNLIYPEQILSIPSD